MRDSICAHVIVTDFGNVALSKTSLSILDGLCPMWRKQIDNKRFRNKQVLAAREFLADLEVTARTVNRILWTRGKPPLEML